MKYHQRGITHIVLPLTIATAGLIIYFFVSSTLPFKDKLFSYLYPKKTSFAQGEQKGMIPPPNRPPAVPLITGSTNGTNQHFLDYKIQAMDFDGQKPITILALPNILSVADSVLQNQLASIKAAGMDAVLVDIPWKNIEPSEGVFDFSLAKSRLEMIANEGLLMQIGINIALNEPAWFRDKYQDIDFVSEEGKRVRDYEQSAAIEFPSYWHPQTKVTYEDVASHYAQAFSNDLLLRDKILYYYLNVGHWGEPFYPIIYNYASPSAPPYFYYWAYDPYAQAQFNKDMQAKYTNNLSQANSYWKTNFTAWGQVLPPRPGQQTPNYWMDFLTWYRDQKNAFIGWAFSTFSKYTDRPFGSTAIADYYNTTEWNQTITAIANNKGRCATSGCQDNTSYPEIKRMYNAGAVIPQLTSQHLFDSPADLPANCLTSPWSCFAGKIVKQTWGANYPVLIVGESLGDYNNPGQVADVVNQYGFDGMRYVGPTYLLNSDGTFNSTNFQQIAAAMQKVKSYRNIASVYTDRIKYVIDWGDGNVQTTNFFSPGVQYIFTHKWNSAGTYQVKVKAIDTANAESFWTSPLTVTITSSQASTPALGPCAGVNPGNCIFDTRTSSNGLHWVVNFESVFANGKYWNWDSNGNPLPGNGSLLSSVYKYADICQNHLTDCNFDTRAFASGLKWGETTSWESVTAYGKYWNWELNGNPLPGNGSLLSSVPRYQDVCKYVPDPNNCKFDTREFFIGSWAGSTAWESVTAYGRYWNWDIATGKPMPGNGSLLNSVPRYQDVCKYTSDPNSCKFDTRSFFIGSWAGSTAWESVTAYGRYWNWDIATGKPMPGNGSTLDSVKRYIYGFSN